MVGVALPVAEWSSVTMPRPTVSHHLVTMPDRMPLLRWWTLASMPRLLLPEASADATPDVGAGGGDGICTRGFYSSHPNLWGVSQVVIGSVSYNETACLSLMSLSVGGDESLQLADQFITAVENSGWNNSTISPVMTQAQVWFNSNQPEGGGNLPWGTHCALSTDPGCQALTIQLQLAAWNQAGPCNF